MTFAALVLAVVVFASFAGCHTLDVLPNELTKGTYQSYSPYNGTTQYYFDEIEDVDEDMDEEDPKAEDDDRVYKNPRKLPSSECPRNEELASFMGQECLRKCTMDEDCKSKKKHCLCDGLCGMSCVKPERECDELPNPEHGVVIMTGRLFSDKATYSCEIGYQLIGRDHRTCHASGTWSGSDPYCKQSVFCKSPPVIENAINNAFPDQLTYDVGAEVEYRCENGFMMRGFAKAKCLAMDISASWYGPEVTCEPRTCGSPSIISNGWHQGDCTDFGCRIYYKCADEYELIGKSERLCHSDGYWVPKEPPSCVPVDCGPPENPFNGNAIFTSTSYNSVVSYECKFGNLLSGEPTRRCGADGKWSGITPSCQEIDCGSPGELHNGWLENTESGTGLGATIIYRCQDGMLLVGNASTVCLADGNWRYPPPLCLAPCVVPAIQQGIVNVSRSNDSTAIQQKAGAPVLAKHGDKLIVKCIDKYEPSGGNNTFATCNNGTWTYIPKCEPAHCKHLPQIPKNGIVLAPRMGHGARAKFACKDGFVMTGDRYTECRFGNWSGKTPICEEVYCPFPGYIEHGKVLLVGSMGVYDYRPYVKKIKNNKQIAFECDREYTIETGPVGATCIDGKWSPEVLPKCVPSNHPKLRLSRSIQNETEWKSYILNTDKLNSSMIFKVVETLQNLWIRSKRALSAQNQQVMKAKQTSNKDQTAKSPGTGRSRSREPGDTLFKEYDGEEVNTTITEEKNPQKTVKGKGKHGKRKVGPCEPLSNNTFAHFEVIKSGKHGNSTHSHGTVIKVTCNVGYYTNIVNNTAKCWRTRWKPAKPDCKLKPCLVPYTANGYYRTNEPTFLNITENTEISDGEVVTLSCFSGFNLKGSPRIQCIKGDWDVDTSIPECTPSPCELPSINHGQYLLGYRAGLTIANGSFVTFQCDPEFIKTTSVSIECVLGNLVPKLPSCKRDGGLFITGADILKKSELGTIDLLSGLRGSCGPPESVQGSLIFRNGELLKDAEKSFPDGTEVTFNCIGNIIGEKVTWRIRCEDGNWIGRSLNCITAKPIEETNTTGDNTTCMFRNSEPNVITFIGDSMITNELTEFNAGTILVSRCSDIGKYAMEGSNKRVCINGEWSGQRPVCFGLNQENDYALEKPPTILFRHQLGPIAQSNEGKLIVYPGTILHMECLWIKRFGTPLWNVSHSFRKYPEGWTTDPGRDPNLEYRLSIYHASRDDSGVFSCITPTRHTHSVEIIVKAVHCPSIPSKRSLTIGSQNTKLNTRVTFSCAKGYNLIGASEINCLPSGNWSDPIPSCEIIECDEIEKLIDPNLRVAVLSHQVGGEIMFSCMQGFGLTGPTHSTCLPTGEWEQPFPTCAAVTCPWPGDPPHGYLAISQNSYRPGERVSVNCEPYYVLDGQPNLVCQDNGNWSASLPVCVQACPYPGTVIRGRMSMVKFYYAIDDVITFSCDDNFKIKGVPILKCLKYGKWSNSIPTCAPKNETQQIV
ncbi:sushi, von Willebrand factor type A, EGF and pentraxin domain-containing protein 1 isoform X2 [Daktulosphaira vitifoliae]|uniref:sushi, von Willebrand factor type A, EGF and pentraxin domain-containing protein 1 isoform X2 n=1 Tax=Daktulosphaira vitifoliae TaxID=58002 RepID=UPI0021A97B82|nr:sushi, von Willebrand factor type A, EGF and pentraxin domain-containing protein 1 isoform X2 [Daktulosphaira vitifoliae]